MKTRDEHYVIDLCDQVLKLKAKRQRRSTFCVVTRGAVEVLAADCPLMRTIQN
jgi:hypothetical protein